MLDNSTKNMQAASKENDIVLILSKQLEWDRIALMGSVNFHNTSGMLMVPREATMSRVASTLNRPYTYLQSYSLEIQLGLIKLERFRRV